MFEKRPDIDKQKIRDYIYGDKKTISNKKVNVKNSIDEKDIDFISIIYIDYLFRTKSLV